MPEISQWELDKLKEHEQKYYMLLKERDNFIEAITPFVNEIVEMNIKNLFEED